MIILILYIFNVTAVEHIRLGPGGATKIKTSKFKLYITNGKDDKLNGICMFFLRPDASKGINMENITKVS